MHIFIILKNGLCHILEQCGLTSLRWGNDHTTLSLSNRTDQIHNTHSGSSTRALHDQALVWKNRCHILEAISLLAFTWMETIDRGHV